MSERWKCYKCGMSFRIKDPHPNVDGRETCAEPGCEVYFWHCEDTVAHEVIVGIWPANLAEAVA